MELAARTPIPRDGTETNAERTFSCHERDNALMALAANQDALVHAVQAVALGFSPFVIRRRVRSGRWRRVLPRVYKLTGAPTTDRQRVRAAALWAGSGAIVSHGSAGWLWGLDGIRSPERPELTVPRRRAPRSELVVVHRSLLLPEVDRTEIDGIPVTSAARTIIDLAGALDDPSVEAALESGFKRGLYRDAFVRWRVRELGEARPGHRRLVAMLDARGRDAPALESAFEVRAWRVFVGSALPRPIRQFWIRSGDRRFRLDFAWPDKKVAVECDGYTSHGGRAGFRRDRRKIAALAAIKWRVIPVTWEDVTEHPQQLLADVRAALSQAP